MIIPRRCFKDGDEVPFRAFMKAAIVYHWEKERAARAARDAATAEATAKARAERQVLEPELNLKIAEQSQGSSSDTQWSRIALKNVQPSEVGSDNAWYG